MATTLVTGLWDIKRDTLGDGWNRSFQHYLNKFEELLRTECNMIIYIEEEHYNFVKERRKDENTLIIVRELSWFVQNGEIFNKIQNIRKNPKWLNQSSWLTDSTQAKLEMYNPLVMGKMFLLNDAVIFDKFNSSHLVWIDAGLTNTVHWGYFTHDNVIEKIENEFDKFSFICFPYDGKVEIHGFEYEKICKYSNNEVDKVARGGFFGGPKDTIHKANGIYYDLLNRTLDEGLMGTEESLFTIMCYLYPDLFNFYEINNDGLLWLFFENLKNGTLNVKKEKNKNFSYLDKKVGLYVITFNSPKQFETLIISMLEYDKNFIERTDKFLLDNSTDLTTTDRYLELCNEYNFKHIKKDNIGICGGRQFVAEHFDNSDLDYYYFFEDDMFFYPKMGEVCRNGFNRYVDNLFNKIIKIMDKENFDFLKLNFSEFYGDNSTQWAWYNVPQSVREEHWPNYNKLPEIGLDENAPKTKINEIKIIDGVPYASGEIYICNWPIILNKEGNHRCYIETKWAHPYENTWMSHVFQETKRGKIKPGILLMTPTEHDRFDHYPRDIRREN